MRDSKAEFEFLDFATRTRDSRPPTLQKMGTSGASSGRQSKPRAIDPECSCRACRKARRLERIEPLTGYDRAWFVASGIAWLVTVGYAAYVALSA